MKWQRDEAAEGEMKEKCPDISAGPALENSDPNFTAVLEFVIFTLSFIC